jgi:hypothetical protein
MLFLEKFFAFINLHVPHDKALHFMAGVLMALCLAWAPFWFSCAVIVVVATFKEIYDAFFPQIHSCEAMDIVWTIAGAVPIWLVKL